MELISGYPMNRHEDKQEGAGDTSGWPTLKHYRDDLSWSPAHSAVLKAFHRPECPEYFQGGSPWLCLKHPKSVLPH